MSAELLAVLRTLEEQLLTPEVHHSADAAAALLADDFVEFGASGATYDKARILDVLKRRRVRNRAADR